MYQAIEAICTNGTIQPLEPVVFEESEHLVILRLPRTAFQPKPRMQARGAMKGVLSSVDEFIADKAVTIGGVGANSFAPWDGSKKMIITA